MRSRVLGLVAAVAAVVSLVAAPAATAKKSGSERLRKAVTVRSIINHERALQNIAERNGGIRASGTRGFDKSVEYVAKKLRRAGYRTQIQNFDFPFFQENSPSQFARVSPDPRTYTPTTDFATMQYSGSGDVTASITPVDLTLPPTPEPSSTSGCEDSDFAGFPAGT